MSQQWKRVENELPPEGAAVDTISPEGVEAPLVRQGSLWFFPDMSMYVYYTPEFWRARE